MAEKRESNKNEEYDTFEREYLDDRERYYFERQDATTNNDSEEKSQSTVNDNLSQETLKDESPFSSKKYEAVQDGHPENYLNAYDRNFSGVTKIETTGRRWDELSKVMKWFTYIYVYVVLHVDDEGYEYDKVLDAIEMCTNHLAKPNSQELPESFVKIPSHILIAAEYFEKFARTGDYQARKNAEDWFQFVNALMCEKNFVTAVKGIKGNRYGNVYNRSPLL